MEVTEQNRYIPRGKPSFYGMAGLTGKKYNTIRRLKGYFHKNCTNWIDCLSRRQIRIYCQIRLKLIHPRASEEKSQLILHSHSTRSSNGALMMEGFPDEMCSFSWNIKQGFGINNIRALLTKKSNQWNCHPIRNSFWKWYNCGRNVQR